MEQAESIWFLDKDELNRDTEIIRRSVVAAESAATVSASNAAKLQAMNAVPGEDVTAYKTVMYRNGTLSGYERKITDSILLANLRQYQRQNVQQTQSHGQSRFGSNASSSQTTASDSKSNEMDEINIKNFVLLVLPPLINHYAGVVVLWLATFGGVMRLIHEKRECSSIKNLLLYSASCCVPAVIASTLGQEVLLASTFWIELWQLCNADQEDIVTPNVFAVVAIPLTYFPSIWLPSLWRLEEMIWGFIIGSLTISLLQYKRGFKSEYPDSVAHSVWYHWSRPELMLVLSIMFWYCFRSWTWLGCCFVSGLVSIIQSRVRQVSVVNTIWLWLWIIGAFFTVVGSSGTDSELIFNPTCFWMFCIARLTAYLCSVLGY